MSIKVTCAAAENGGSASSSTPRIELEEGATTAQRQRAIGHAARLSARTGPELVTPGTARSPSPQRRVEDALRHFLGIEVGFGEVSGRAGLSPVVGVDPVEQRSAQSCSAPPGSVAPKAHSQRTHSTLASQPRRVASLPHLSYLRQPHIQHA
jgi:hypothetical protein